MAFSSRGNGKRHSWCKDCFKEYNRQYYAKNSENIKETARTYRKGNVQKTRQTKSNCYNKRREYYLTKAKIHSNNRRARTIGTLNHKDWILLVEQIGGKCAYCGTICNATIDHIVPISKGGLNDISNILPACKSCNCSKGTKDLDEWLFEKNYWGYSDTLIDDYYDEYNGI